jgi:hypothetical protein
MDSDVVPEADEADLLEQSEPVVELESTPDPPALGLEVPEADAIEQAQPAPLIEDY